MLFFAAIIPSVFAAPDPPGTSTEEDAGESLFRPSAYSGIYLSESAQFDGLNGAEFDFFEARLDAPIYGKKLGDWRFALSVRYRYNELSLSGDFDQEIPTDLSLHGAELRTDLIWKPDDSKWQFWTSIRPEIYSDFENVSGDHIGGTVIGTLGYTFTDNFAMGLGVYAGRGLGDYQLIPAIGMIWDITDTLRLEVLPPKPMLRWSPTDSWVFKIGAFPAGGTWGLGGDQKSDVDALFYKGLRAGLGLERKIANQLWFNGWIGATVFQSVELESDDDTIFEEDLDDSLFGYVGVRYYFW